MAKEKDKSFNNFIDKDEESTEKEKDEQLDEEFSFEDEDIPEEERVADLTKGDLDSGEMFEGEKIDLEEILNENIIVRGIKIRPSSFYEGDYAIIQIEKDGKLYVINTSSSVLMDQITKIEDKIPFRCKITKHKSPVTNRRYYTITPVR